MLLSEYVKIWKRQSLQSLFKKAVKELEAEISVNNNFYILCKGQVGVTRLEGALSSSYRLTLLRDPYHGPGAQ